jgi:C2H2 transcription facotor
MMAAHMGQPAYFYYRPDANQDKRQHGHFINHHALPQQQMFPVVPTLPSTPIYSRPNSSCSQQPLPSQAFTSIPSNGTPTTSAQALQRPTMVLQSHPSKLMLETEFRDSEAMYYPATPALSTSGSSMSSPSSSHDVLATPLNPMFSGLDGCERVKPEAEVITESVETFDWSSCGSPPLTPSKLPIFHHFPSAFWFLSHACL